LNNAVRCDTAVQEHAIVTVIGLTSAHNKRAVFNRNRQVIVTETGDSQCDPVGCVRRLFDVVRGVSVVAGLRSACDTSSFDKRHL